MRHCVDISKTKTAISLLLLSLPGLVFAEKVSLDNPLDFNGPNAAADLIQAIVNIFQIVLTPIVVFFIIYSGFLFVTARGNPETLEQAKRSLVYAIIGGVIIVGATAIGAIVGNTVNEF